MKWECFIGGIVLSPAEARRRRDMIEDEIGTSIGNAVIVLYHEFGSGF
jgi:hypothetical protein